MKYLLRCLLPLLLLGCDSTKPAQNDTTASTGAALTGEWVLREFPGHDFDADNPPTVRFEEEGRVSGFSGCNRFSGTYSGWPDTLTFGPLVTTRMACPGDNVEAAFHAVLDADDLTARLANQELTLRAGVGELTLVRRN